MEHALLTALLLISMGMVFYLLYINGFLVTSAKKAAMYIGTMRGRKASFTACSGYIKRVIRFKESGTIHFHFHLELSKGEVTAELLDANKQRVLRLSSSDPTASASVQASARYYLVFRFKAATGNYLLSWS